jgi:hypothetical protein
MVHSRNLRSVSTQCTKSASNCVRHSTRQCEKERPNAALLGQTEWARFNALGRRTNTRVEGRRSFRTGERTTDVGGQVWLHAALVPSELVRSPPAMTVSRGEKCARQPQSQRVHNRRHSDHHPTFAVRPGLFQDSFSLTLTKMDMLALPRHYSALRWSWRFARLGGVRWNKSHI